MRFFRWLFAVKQFQTMISPAWGFRNPYLRNASTQILYTFSLSSSINKYGKLYIIETIYPSIYLIHRFVLTLHLISSPTRRLPPRSLRRLLSVLKFVKVSSFSVLLTSLLPSTIPLLTLLIFLVVKPSLVLLVSVIVYIKDATLHP